MNKWGELLMADLCCGIGGFSEAFGREGVKNDLAVDVDSHAVDTYVVNSSCCTVYVEDVDNLEALIEHGLGACDIWCCGFPCQPYSAAGKKLGREDPRAGVMDSIIRAARRLKPEVLFLENVAGFLTAGGGAECERLENELTDLGYNVHMAVYNSYDFGEVQSRKRLYIVATRNKGFQFSPIPEVKLPRKQLKDYLDENVHPRYTITQKAWDGFESRLKRNEAAGKGFGYQVVSPETTKIRTLLARYGKDGAECLVSQAAEGLPPRKLTPIEGIRLQGWRGDRFEFPHDVPLIQRYKQVGNSVCVTVVQHIAKDILAYLKHTKYTASNAWVKYISQIKGVKQ